VNSIAKKTETTNQHIQHACLRVGTVIFGKRELPGSYYWNENKQGV
jgi:CO dehydrogenase/acetyl-CoA synthase alpha subunit